MEPGFSAILAVMAGGAFGGMARAWLCTRIHGAAGVMLVNGTGSLALGYLAARAAPESALWLFLATGVLGAYTTVSGFALQTLQMWQSGARFRAAANVAGSVTMAVAAAALGLWAGL